MENLRNRYVLYVCPDCGDQHQYAGFCYDCMTRLMVYQCVPVERILQTRDEIVESSSPVPAAFVEFFVDRLLSS